MIDKNTAQSSILERLEKLPAGHCLEIRTYKRNRRVLFRRGEQEHWSVLQDGFEKELFEDVDRDKLPRLLRSLLRKEFPRSNKIRLYTMGPCNVDESPKLRR